MTKQEAVEKFVERDFSSIPQEWVKIVMEAKGEYHALPMWGTMWFVNFNSWGEKLMKNSAVQQGDDEKAPHYDEEMAGANCILDKNGEETCIFIYEIEGEYLIGIHGAGWNFFDGAWDKLYDFFGLTWHDTKCTHYQCNKEAVENTDACHEHTFCYCDKVSGKHYKPDCENPATCTQCGKNVDLLVAFTANKICGKCTKKNHKKVLGK